MSTEGFDMNALLQQAMAMQEQLAEAQETAAAQTVEGHAGGGAVRITMTGAGDVTGVRISAEAVATGDVELLEDLVLAAIHDANTKSAKLRQDAIGDLGGLGGLLPGN